MLTSWFGSALLATMRTCRESGLCCALALAVETVEMRLDIQIIMLLAIISNKRKKLTSLLMIGENYQNILQLTL